MLTIQMNLQTYFSVVNMDQTSAVDQFERVLDERTQYLPNQAIREIITLLNNGELYEFEQLMEKLVVTISDLEDMTLKITQLIFASWKRGLPMMNKACKIVFRVVDSVIESSDIRPSLTTLFTKTNYLHQSLQDQYYKFIGNSNPEISAIEHLTNLLGYSPYGMFDLRQACERIVLAYGPPPLIHLRQIERTALCEEKIDHPVYEFVIDLQSGMESFADYPMLLPSGRTEDEMMKESLVISNDYSLSEVPKLSREEFASLFVNMHPIVEETTGETLSVIQTYVALYKNVISLNDYQFDKLATTYLALNKRLQMAYNQTLIRFWGPSNRRTDSISGSYDLTLPQGCRDFAGCHMLLCEGHSDEENEHRDDWFTGVCGYDKCNRRIEERHQAKRIPLLDGGWEGCYCSWRHANRDIGTKNNELPPTKEDIEDVQFQHIMIRTMKTLTDRIGIYDRTYAVDPSLIKNATGLEIELTIEEKAAFEAGIESTYNLFEDSD